MCGVPVERSRRLPAPPDRARPPGRGLRADRGSGRGAEARRQIGRAARRRAARHARHHHRGPAARPGPRQPPRGAGSRLRADETPTSPSGSRRVDISTGAFTVGETAQAGLPALLARLEPREIVVPDALARRAGVAGPLLDERGAAVTPRGARIRRHRRGRAAPARMVRRRDARRVRQLQPRRDRRPPRPRSPMSPAPRSARGRRCSPPGAGRARPRGGDRRRDPRQSRTDAHARRASARARCSPRSTSR